MEKKLFQGLVRTDIAVLHTVANVINSEVNEGLSYNSIINIARECDAFGVKTGFT